ncbi:MAG TPA: PrkA family serine protein kinase [Nitrososphaeraceae archaeon]
MSFLKSAGQRLVAKVSNEISLDEYLTACKTDPLMYASASERLLHAIGEPNRIDTRNHETLSRIFSNETISTYDVFKEIYGLENPLRDVVSFIKHAAQGLEERKQILYLLGPVGSSKSTIVRLLKRLMESVPFYAIKGSPVFDNPLSLFTKEDSKELGIPERYLNVIPSPWLTKRIQDLGGDITQLRVVKLYPSEIHQIAISHLEPGDENNQDISSLVGKLNIREVGEYDVSDPDAYSFTGGLCLGNRGIVEFAEMFKAPIKSLNPLLEATQSNFYKGTESIAAIPFDGIIIAHSNESEWQKFRTDPKNEALIDRIFISRIPYCLRYSEEKKIYEKMLRESSLSEAPCAPKTLDILAQFSVLSRLVISKHSPLEVKMKTYNGESLKHKNINAKSVFEYQKEAHESGLNEGFFGQSTRFAFKAVAKTFNYAPEEVSANPLHLLFVLSESVKQEHLAADEEAKLFEIIKYLNTDFLKFLDGEIKKAFIESYDEHGQNIFDRYITYADNWLNEEDYRDPSSNMLKTSKDLEKYLEGIEVPSNISNKRDFRNEVVKFCLRHRASNSGQNPRWTSYHKIREVIEAKIFNNIQDMLPIISSHAQGTADEKQHHNDFVDRMCENGYTKRQVNILVDWYIKSIKS